MSKELTIMYLWPFIENLLNLENIDQAQFSSKTGIDTPTLSKIKNKTVTGKRQLGQIAKYLQIEINELKERINKFNAENQNQESMENHEKIINRLENEIIRLEEELKGKDATITELLNRMHLKKPGHRGTGS